MEQTIDIKLLKENPQLFFSQLPEKAEKEFENLLEFILFKYDIKKVNQNETSNQNKFNLFKEKPIKVEKIVKYSREELHER